MKAAVEEMSHYVESGLLVVNEDFEQVLDTTFSTKPNIRFGSGIAPDEVVR